MVVFIFRPVNTAGVLRCTHVGLFFSAVCFSFLSLCHCHHYPIVCTVSSPCFCVFDVFDVFLAAQRRLLLTLFLAIILLLEFLCCNTFSPQFSQSRGFYNSAEKFSRLNMAETSVHFMYTVVFDLFLCFTLNTSNKTTCI